MKDLLIDASGDIVIAKHDIQLVSNKNLTAQKVRLILSTNKGEWELDENEGINFRAMLTKIPDIDEITDNIIDGLRQVDETFEITQFSYDIVNRHLTINFEATNEAGETVSLVLANGVNGNNDEIEIITCDVNATKILNEGSTLDKICICSTDSDVINCKI